MGDDVIHHDPPQVVEAKGVRGEGGDVAILARLNGYHVRIGDGLVAQRFRHSPVGDSRDLVAGLGLRQTDQLGPQGGVKLVDQKQRKADPQSRRQKPLAPFAAPTTRPFGSAKPKTTPQLSRHSLHPLRAEYAKRGLS